MTEYFFGLGSGWLPKVADDIAKKHGASLCNYTDAECHCGRGCSPHACKSSQRHWFACPNRGSPFDGKTAKAVMDDLKEANIL